MYNQLKKVYWIKLILIVSCLIPISSCTHSVTRYRIQREPIRENIPVEEKILVVDSYSTVQSIFPSSPYQISIALMPFEVLNHKLLNDMDSNSKTDYNKLFIEMFRSHPDYNNRFIIYDDFLIKSLLELDNADFSSEMVNLISNKLGIKYLITGIIKNEDNFEFDMKIYDTYHGTILTQFLYNTKNSSVFADALNFIYNDKIPNYTSKNIITGYRNVAIGYNDQWVSYQNEETSMVKSLLFWTITTAALTTAATIYEFDITDLYEILSGNVN